MNALPLLLFYIVIGVISSNCAKKRGRNPYIWFGIGFFLGILTLLVLFLLPALKSSQNREEGNVAGKQPIPTPAKINLETLDSTHFNTLWYYLDHNHDQFGPMSIDALSRVWREGKIAKTTFVWNEFMENWKRFEEVLIVPKGLSLTNSKPIQPS